MIHLVFSSQGLQACRKISTSEDVLVFFGAAGQLPPFLPSDCQAKTAREVPPAALLQALTAGQQIRSWY